MASQTAVLPGDFSSVRLPLYCYTLHESWRARPGGSGDEVSKEIDSHKLNVVNVIIMFWKVSSTTENWEIFHVD